MLIYAAAQFLLIFLNLCDWCFWKRDSEGKVRSSKAVSSQLTAKDFLWYFTFLIAICLGVLSSVGGTSKSSPSVSTWTQLTDQPLS